jgi:hypothetical protein
MGRPEGPPDRAVTDMGVLLPNDKHWQTANWVAQAFYDDAATFLVDGSALTTKIKFCLDAGLDTLDLRDADAATLTEISRIVDQVIELNGRSKGRNFHDPTMFPVYESKLADLRQLVDAVISPPR